MNHKVVLLPRLDDSTPADIVQRLVGRSKTIRLEALQTSPEAFASNYERESQFEDEVWNQRLRNPLARSIVGLDISNEDLTEKIVEKSILKLAADCPWIGTAVLFGPKSFQGSFPAASISPSDWFANSVSPQNNPEKRTEDANGVSTWIYVVNAMYVSPDWRKHKVAATLMVQALELAQQLLKERAKPGDCGAVLVFVDKDNPIARRFYQKCGFEQVREETYQTLKGVTKTALALTKHLTV